VRCSHAQLSNFISSADDEESDEVSMKSSFRHLTLYSSNDLSTRELEAVDELIGLQFEV